MTLKILLISLAVAIVLPRIPVVGKFFNIINTALHEFGHALMALMTGGEVRKIQLFQDTSGVTTTQSGNRLSAFFVSLAGYPFAVSIAWLSFYLVQQNASLALVVALSVLFFIMLLFWIRNGYGALWVVLFCAVNVFLIYKGNADHIQIAATFYAVMVLAESVYSAFVLLVLSLRDHNKAGDATNLEKLTHIPAVIWSLLFLAYTLWVVYRVWLMLSPVII
ncbi:MAG: M50 family metallopeptidase [Bacteroidales bacterium]|nr:M50 family metallopeptidase [Bacteroidales bacterium]